MNPRVLAGLVMFLTFFSWGVYLVPMGKYLPTVFSDDKTVTGFAYAMGPLAAMISPLLAGWLADRTFAPRKFLAILTLVAGGILFLLPLASTPLEFRIGLFIHSLAFFAALPLLNSVVMASLADPGREFGAIRLWGTIGWIVSGVALGTILPKFLGTDVATSPLIFQLGGATLMLVGLLARGLADPAPVAKSTIASGGIGRLLSDSKFLLFLVFSVLFCIPLALYYSHANRFLASAGIDQTETFMTVGQLSEVAFLLLLPVLATRFSAKAILMFGMACWALRYWLFAEFPSSESTLFVAIALHGACYDFFFVTGMLYADRKAPEDLRNTAQSVVAWATLGLGLFIGNLLSPLLEKNFISKDAKGLDVFASEFWLYPAAFAVALLVVFALVFRDDTRLSESQK